MGKGLQATQQYVYFHLLQIYTQYMFSDLICLAFYASMAKAFAGKTAVENANLGVQGNSIDFVTSSSGV